MNTEPNAIRVLCFGDSNTHGRDPKRKSEEGIKARFPVGVRWTSQLQKMLGNKYEIIEEGLGGRTTDLDDSESEGKNGLTYLIPCLESHDPIDSIVLMLGTNDLKEVFNRSALDIAYANKRLIDKIRARFQLSKIVLVSPILVDELHPNAGKYKGATAKSKMLAIELKKVAEEKNCFFIDLAKYVEPSKYDGLHIDEKYQATVAQHIYHALIK